MNAEIMHNKEVCDVILMCFHVPL